MPLDSDARGYADQLYTHRLDLADRQHHRRLKTITQRFAAQAMAQSGPHIKAIGEKYARHVADILDARAESLLAAHERAGIPFGEASFKAAEQEIQQLYSRDGRIPDGALVHHRMPQLKLRSRRAVRLFTRWVERALQQ